MEKLKIALRYIFAIPIAIVGMALGAILMAISNRFVASPDSFYTLINNFLYANVIGYLIFFAILNYVVPNHKFGYTLTTAIVFIGGILLLSAAFEITYGAKDLLSWVFSILAIAWSCYLSYTNGFGFENNNKNGSDKVPYDKNIIIGEKISEETVEDEKNLITQSIKNESDIVEITSSKKIECEVCGKVIPYNENGICPECSKILMNQLINEQIENSDDKNSKKIDNDYYIFDYIKKQMNLLGTHTEKYDGVISYDNATEDSLMGYFSYYIAGIYDEDIAKRIIDLYVKEKDTINSNIIKENIQNSYSEARKISEKLMENQMDEHSIIMWHSKAILRRISWEESDLNLSIFISIFSNFYEYIKCLYNNNLSSFKEDSIFDGFEATDNIQKLKTGEPVKLSMSQIVNLIINLPDAQSNLSENDYNKVSKLFNEFRKCTSDISMSDMKDYYKVCIDIIRKFDEIAPYESYSGLNPIEASLLMKEVREKISNNAEKMEKEFKEDMKNDILDEPFSKEEQEDIKALVNGSMNMIDEEDAKNFMKVLRVYVARGKDESLKEFEKLAVKLKEKYGALNSVSKVSFFIGSLNANGIIDKESVRPMTIEYMNKIRNSNGN